MGNLFKKKDTEPIKKVKVKLACSCTNYHCFCHCVATESFKYDTTSKERGSLDAEECGIEYWKQNGVPAK